MSPTRITEVGFVFDFSFTHRPTRSAAARAPRSPPPHGPATAPASASSAAAISGWHERGKRISVNTWPSATAPRISGDTPSPSTDGSRWMPSHGTWGSSPRSASTDARSRAAAISNVARTTSSASAAAA
jgi:hypothetical protein